MGRTACTEPQCLYSRAIPLLPLWAVRPVQSLSACTVELYLYFPYEPYGLYSRAIPLLPLWAVRPVQSLSACTVEHTSTPPMSRTACTEPQCLYSRAIPLLPLLYGLYRASVPVQGALYLLPFYLAKLRGLCRKSETLLQEGLCHKIT